MTRMVLHAFSILTLLTSVFALASFTTPGAQHGNLNLVIGDIYTVEWTGEENDYGEVSLGLKSQADGSISWLISHNHTNTSQSFPWKVQLEKEDTLQQGNVFQFILFNGTDSETQVSSPFFTISAATTPSTTPKQHIISARYRKKKQKPKFSGGVTAGIVIASFAGFLLLVFVTQLLSRLAARNAKKLAVERFDEERAAMDAGGVAGKDSNAYEQTDVQVELPAHPHGALEVKRDVSQEP